MARTITLLTDFGIASTYPAQMKGVILARCPGAVLVDLSHDVPRHDVRTAAFMLASAAKAFPQGTIHAAVVDPQVERRGGAGGRGGGTDLPGAGQRPADGRPGRRTGTAGPAAPRPRGEYREPLALPHRRVEHVPRPRHFAPVAAALRGTPLEDLGPPVASVQWLDVPAARRDGGSIHGEVLYVDPFGNLVTNITGDQVAGADPLCVAVHVGGAVIRGLSRAYSDVPAGMLLIYIGSAGFLEVAVNRQSASARLGADIGTPVRAGCETS